MNKAKATPPKKSKKGKRKKLTPEDIAKNLYRKDVRDIFLKSGFRRVPGISDREFFFRNKFKSDFDDVFIYKNIIIFNEYTLTKSSNISDHLKPKKIIYDTVLENKDEFLEYLLEKFPTLKDEIESVYKLSDLRIVILYCSKNDVDPTYKDIVPDIKFFDYPVLRYFKVVTDAVKLSAKFEMFKFLGLENKDVGENVFKNRIFKTDIKGTILPESHSNFKKGFKVVSFYIDPETLLTHSYVLRKQGWRDDDEVYQRMIMTKKIIAIRRHLLKEERVFINNIIVTLPPETKIKDEDGNTVDTKNLQSTQPVIVEIPDAYNVIGLIDGQHRVFAYHEGGERDEEVKILRKKQNLLVTGIIYPRNILDTDKIKFEAKLFLEINSNQSNAKSDLKQSISLILNPFAGDSIAKSLINRLNFTGPLANKFEKHFYENDKIKTTSVVSYGLRPIIKLSGTDSFYHIWSNPNKSDLIDKKDELLLKKYVEFAASELNIFFSAFRISIAENRWTSNPKDPNKTLSTTIINGLIICFRKLIEENKIGDLAYYQKKFTGVDKFNFKEYKSSQYGSLARKLFDQFFA